MRSTVLDRGDAVLAALTHRAQSAPQLTGQGVQGSYGNSQAHCDVEQWISKDSDALCDFEQRVSEPTQDQPSNRAASRHSSASDLHGRFNLFPRPSNYMKCIVKNTFLEVELELPSERPSCATPRSGSVPTSFRVPEGRASTSREDLCTPTTIEDWQNVIPTGTVAEFVDEDALSQKTEGVDVIVDVKAGGSEFESVAHGNDAKLQSIAVRTQLEGRTPKMHLANLFTKTSKRVKCIVKNTFLEVHSGTPSPATRGRSWPAEACVSGAQRKHSRDSTRTVEVLLADTPTHAAAQLDALHLKHDGRRPRGVRMPRHDRIQTSHVCSNTCPAETVAEFLELPASLSPSRHSSAAGGSMPDPIVHASCLELRTCPGQQFTEPSDEAAAQQSRTVTNVPRAGDHRFHEIADELPGVDGHAEDEYSSNKKGKVVKRHPIRTLSHGATYLVGIEMDQDFNVMRRLIGPSAQHIKFIMKEHKNVKVHIRGRGSKQQDAEDEYDPDALGPLTIFIRAPSSPKLEMAAALAEKLLHDVHQQYRDFCSECGASAPTLAVARVTDSVSSPTTMSPVELSSTQMQGVQIWHNAVSNAGCPETQMQSWSDNSLRYGGHASQRAQQLLSAPSRFVHGHQLSTNKLCLV